MFRPNLMTPVAVLLTAALGVSVLGCSDSVQEEALTFNQEAVAALHEMQEATFNLERALFPQGEEQQIDGDEANAKLAAYKQSLESGREDVADATVPDLESAREFASAIEEYFEFHNEQYLEVATEAVELVTTPEAPAEEPDQTVHLLFGGIAEERGELWSRITQTQQAFADEVEITLEERNVPE